jgi:hypothetical protein
MFAIIFDPVNRCQFHTGPSKFFGFAVLLLLAHVRPRTTTHANRSRSEADAGRLIPSHGAGSLRPGYSRNVRDVPAEHETRSLPGIQRLVARSRRLRGRSLDSARKIMTNRVEKSRRAILRLCCGGYPISAHPAGGGVRVGGFNKMGIECYWCCSFGKTSKRLAYYKLTILRGRNSGQIPQQINRSAIVDLP